MDLLTVARQCHNDDPWTDAALFPLFLGPPEGGRGVQIGFLPPKVVQAVHDDMQAGRTTAFCLGSSESDTDTGTGMSSSSSAQGSPSSSRPPIWIDPALDTHAKRSDALRAVVEGWRDRGLFPDPLKGWRNELYAIYGPGRKPAFSLERAACALFGLATFGVHATAYTWERSGSGSGSGSGSCSSAGAGGGGDGGASDVDGLRIWVPQRAKSKSTWPGYLDNSVAGGISAGDAPYESMVRECAEEASLPADIVRKGMRPTGVISYFYRTTSGWCQPEVEYTYDILLEPSVKLEPADGEAESFELMGVDEIMERMRNGEFKPNCALVLIDFLIRHGGLTIENCDCDYVKLVCALHNDLRLPGP